MGVYLSWLLVVAVLYPGAALTHCESFGDLSCLGRDKGKQSENGSVVSQEDGCH